MRGHRYSMQFFYDFPGDDGLREMEREVFKAMLANQPKQRIFIEDVIHLDFFQSIFHMNTWLKEKALMVCGKVAAVDLS